MNPSEHPKEKAFVNLVSDPHIRKSWDILIVLMYFWVLAIDVQKYVCANYYLLFTAPTNSSKSNVHCSYWNLKIVFFLLNKVNCIILTLNIFSFFLLFFLFWILIITLDENYSKAFATILDVSLHSFLLTLYSQNIICDVWGLV